MAVAAVLFSIRPRWAAAIGVAASACAVACDPGYAVEGTVRDPSGVAIAGATVTKSCPGGGAEKMSTLADGHFSFGGVGGAFGAEKCSLLVEAPGYTSRTLHTYDVCYFNSEDHSHRSWPCTAAKGDVTLAKCRAGAGTVVRTPIPVQ